MRLSEAILLGAMSSPQSFGDFMDKDGQTCALGAAALAMGVDPAQSVSMRWAVLNTRYSLLEENAKCPACSLVSGWWRRFRNEESDVEDVIVHLNDDHYWTRERIANWLVTIERAHPLTLFTETPQVVVAVDPQVGISSK